MEWNECIRRKKKQYKCVPKTNQQLFPWRQKFPSCIRQRFRRIVGVYKSQRWIRKNKCNRTICIHTVSACMYAYGSDTTNDSCNTVFTFFSFDYNYIILIFFHWILMQFISTIHVYNFIVQIDCIVCHESFVIRWPSLYIYMCLHVCAQTCCDCRASPNTWQSFRGHLVFGLAVCSVCTPAKRTVSFSINFTRHLKQAICASLVGFASFTPTPSSARVELWRWDVSTAENSVARKSTRVFTWATKTCLWIRAKVQSNERCYFGCDACKFLDVWIIGSTLCCDMCWGFVCTVVCRIRWCLVVVRIASSVQRQPLCVFQLGSAI